MLPKYSTKQMTSKLPINLTSFGVAWRKLCSVHELCVWFFFGGGVYGRPQRERSHCFPEKPIGNLGIKTLWVEKTKCFQRLSSKFIVFIIAFKVLLILIC